MQRPGPTVEYRELRRRDLPSLSKVIAQAYGALERATGLDEVSTAQLLSLRRPGLWVLVRLLQRLRIAPLRFLVAVEGGQVVGSTIVTFRDKAGYIGGVSTDARARGRGVATQLMERARAVARAKGKAWMALDVESDNETALRVYRRLGYTEVERVDWHVGPLPPPTPMSQPTALEFKTVDKVTLAWVFQSTLPAIREALPPSPRTLTHVEIYARPSRARPKMWKLTVDGRALGLVRCHYSATTRTGFLLPVGTHSSLPQAALAPLIVPAIEWLRSLGANRVALCVPDKAEGWAGLTAALGLPFVASETLMIRPSGD